MFDLYSQQCLCTGGASPIIIDTRGEGIKLTPASEGVLFDLAANGKLLRYSWTKPDSANAFLVLDRNGNGRIDDGSELFGNYSPQPPSAKPNGFLALGEFDKPENGGNGDGVIDSHDAVFNSLRLWIDANHNGVSEPDELFPPPSLGVHSLSLGYRESERRDRYGNTFRYRAIVNPDIQRRNEEVGPWAYDVFLVGASQKASVTGSTPVSPQDPPNTIYGSKTPEQIPTEVAYTFFLRVSACSDNATSLQKKKCGVIRRAVGLNYGDQHLLDSHLSDFLGAVLPLDQQIAHLRGKGGASTTIRQALVLQRRELIKARVAKIRQDLSPYGAAQFDEFIERMKARIKMVPAPITTE